MNIIKVIAASIVGMAIVLGALPLAIAYAQTPTTVLGSNGTTYTYNANTGMYTASNGSTYNPTGGTYTANGSTYTYNPNSGLYYANGVGYTYNPSTNTYTQATVNPPATNSTPVFYTQTGVPVYDNGALPAGVYYNSSNQPVYYYGSGYFYNPATATYGSIYSPGFVSATYPGATGGTPTAPNTGFGGDTVMTNWALLAASFITFAIGIGYFVRRAARLQAIR